MIWRGLPAVLALAAALTPLGAGAAHDTGVGQGAFSGSQCLFVDRHVIGSWTIAWFPDTSAEPAPGLCLESTPHVHPAIYCAQLVATGPAEATLYANGITGGKRYLIKVVDRGPLMDAVGFVEGTVTGDRCGAEAVATSAVTLGDFVLAALP